MANQTYFNLGDLVEVIAPPCNGAIVQIGETGVIRHVSFYTDESGHDQVMYTITKDSDGSTWFCLHSRNALALVAVLTG